MNAYRFSFNFIVPSDFGIRILDDINTLTGLIKGIKYCQYDLKNDIKEYSYKIGQKDIWASKINQDFVEISSIFFMNYIRENYTKGIGIRIEDKQLNLIGICDESELNNVLDNLFRNFSDYELVFGDIHPHKTLNFGSVQQINEERIPLLPQYLKVRKIKSPYKGLNFLPEIETESLPNHVHAFKYHRNIHEKISSPFINSNVFVIHFMATWQMFFGEKFYYFIPKGLIEEYSSCISNELVYEKYRKIKLYENEFEDTNGYNTLEQAKSLFHFRYSVGFDSFTHRFRHLPIINTYINIEHDNDSGILVTRYLDKNKNLCFSKDAIFEEKRVYDMSGQILLKQDLYKLSFWKTILRK